MNKGSKRLSLYLNSFNIKRATFASLIDAEFEDLLLILSSVAKPTLRQRFSIEDITSGFVKVELWDKEAK